MLHRSQVQRYKEEKNGFPAIHNQCRFPQNHFTFLSNKEIERTVMYTDIYDILTSLVN